MHMLWGKVQGIVTLGHLGSSYVSGCFARDESRNKPLEHCKGLCIYGQRTGYLQRRSDLFDRLDEGANLDLALSGGRLIPLLDEHLLGFASRTRPRDREHSVLPGIPELHVSALSTVC